jgi:bifunctional non-homologous end joining protein LigD
MLPRIKPMRLARVAKPFDHVDYVFELKHDGFRCVAYIEDGECKLVSRNLRSFKLFESLKKSLATLPVKNAILDGEIICLDREGVSRFNELMSRKGKPVFYAFDLVWLDGDDLRQEHLIERKRRLYDLVTRASSSRLIYAQHIDGSGTAFFEEICKRDLEGIVAKRKRGVYRDDGRGWLKIKNRAYSQAEGRHDLLKRR